MTANEDTPSAHKEPTDTTDEQGNELGAATTILGHEPGRAHVETGVAGDADLQVTAEWLDDEHGAVTVSALVDGADVTLSLDPDDARALASKLTSAASYAEGADR